MRKRARKERQSNKDPHLEDLERPASMEPERLGQGSIERSTLGTELLQQRPLGPGLVERALWYPAAMQLLLQS
jgi:hypothetical protein